MEEPRPYDPAQGKCAVVQATVYPQPVLKRSWFSRKIVSDKGWSVSYKGSSWRVDTYEYFEERRHLVLGGEGATKQWDIFIPELMFWDDQPEQPLDEQSSKRVLGNITAALQWAGYEVGFFYLGNRSALNATVNPRSKPGG